jgi:hypothetical protein
MSTLLHPVGPESPAVYWRRRAVVVAIAIALIIVVVMIVKAAVGGGSDKEASTPPKGEPLPSLSSSGAPAAQVPDCTRTDIDVEAAATDSTFASPAKPTFTVSVRNKGAVKCVIDPAAVHIHVTSGSDRIFDSDDNCDAAADDAANSAADAADAAADSDPPAQSDEEFLEELDTADATADTADDAADTAADAAATTPDAAQTEPATTTGELVLLEPGATQQVLVSWNRERSAPSCEPHLLTTPGNGTYHAVLTVVGVESDDIVFSLG